MPPHGRRLFRPKQAAAFGVVMFERVAFRAASGVQHLFDGRRSVGLAQVRQEALFSQRRGNPAEANCQCSAPSQVAE